MSNEPFKDYYKQRSSNAMTSAEVIDLILTKCNSDKGLKCKDCAFNGMSHCSALYVYNEMVKRQIIDLRQITDTPFGDAENKLSKEAAFSHLGAKLHRFRTFICPHCRKATELDADKLNESDTLVAECPHCGKSFHAIVPLQIDSADRFKHED